MVKHTLNKALAITIFILVVSAALYTVFGGGKIAAANYLKRELPVYSVDRSDDKISISFDCAWGVDHTDDILSNLDRFGVKCTFFAVKFWVEKYPEYCKKIVENGHELQTHSATHPHMAKLSSNAVKEELTLSVNAIEKTVGKKVTLFRCPFGEYDDGVILSAREMGLEVIQWDVDSLDWKDLSAEEIATRVIGKTRSGSIILCHNNGLHTAESLPLIFTALKEKGYSFVPISELIYKNDYTIDSTGRQRKL